MVAVPDSEEPSWKFIVSACLCSILAASNMSEKQQRLVLAIIDFLNQSVNDGTVKSDDKEGLEVASKQYCIETPIWSNLILLS